MYVGNNNTNNFDVEPNHFYNLRTTINADINSAKNDERIRAYIASQYVEFHASYNVAVSGGASFDTFKNLYAFWTEKLTDQLNSELKKNELLINLASNEYGKVIDRKKLKTKVVDFDFKQIQPDGKLKTIVVYTKHARGLMLRFCAENQVETLDELKAFNYENYLLDEKLSSETKLVFTR